MISTKLRALATALLLTTGTAAVVSLATSVTAEAATVRPAVGAALNAAIKAASAGDTREAEAKLHEAESVANLTASERQAIEQTRTYVSAKTGQGPTGAKVKFANDYNAGRYSAVVGEDADALRRNGVMDGQSEIIIAQAYYQMHDYDRCISHIRDMGHVGQSTLELEMRCAYENHDEQAMQGALEQLVVDYNQPKYWSDLLDSANRMSGLSNDDTLDVYRLRLLTNTMKPSGSEYQEAAEIAIQLGSPSEGSAIADKALQMKLLDPNRGQRLLALAKSDAAADVANLAKTAAAAAAAKTGDASLKLANDYWGMGRYQDAVAAAKQALSKGVSNPDEAQIRLAMGYIGLHQRDAAVHALAQVSKSAPAHTLTLARLWSIYARTH